MLIDYKLIEGDTNIFIARRDFQPDPLSDLLTRNSGTRVKIYQSVAPAGQNLQKTAVKKKVKWIPCTIAEIIPH